MEHMLQAVIKSSDLKSYEIIARAQRSASRFELALKGIGACMATEEVARHAVASGQLVSLGIELGPVYRYVFQAKANPSPYVTIVDQFFRRILGSDAKDHIS